MSTKAAKKRSQATGPARIEYLRVENYRALKAIELKDMTPLTVLLGANGSGKSTVFDVFNFLSECFQVGLRQAWDNRQRAKELRTRGADGPIVIELRYRERPQQPIIMVAAQMVPARNSSTSFRVLCAALSEMAS